MKAIFLDQDGTLVNNISFNAEPRGIRLVSDAGPALRLLASLDYHLFVVANHSGIAHGCFDEEAMGPVSDRLSDLLLREQLALEGFYYCPHHPLGTVSDYERIPVDGGKLMAMHGEGEQGARRPHGEPCNDEQRSARLPGAPGATSIYWDTLYAFACACRKPSPGMLLRAAHEHDINLRAPWMIGDVLHDIEAGNRAGCRTLLIDNGNETEWRMGPRRLPTRIAPDLYSAALLIAHHGEP